MNKQEATVQMLGVMGMLSMMTPVIEPRRARGSIKKTRSKKAKLRARRNAIAFESRRRNR